MGEGTQDFKTSFGSFQEWFNYSDIIFQEDESLNNLISLTQVNVRSLNKHWEELNVYLRSQLSHLDVVILTEINVKDSLDTSFQLNGFQRYEICRKDRRGGGIAIFVGDKWEVQEVVSSFEHAEVLTLHIYHQTASFTVGAVYRPPNTNTKLFCLELAQFLNRFHNNEYFILAGDFNIDVIDEEKNPTSDYINTLAAYGLENVINSYTREEHLGNKITRSCIDHVIVRMSNIKKIGGVIKQKVADHYFVAMRMFEEKDDVDLEHSNQYKYIIDNRKVDKAIMEKDWDSVAALDHISAYENLVAMLNKIYDDSIIRVKIRQRKPHNNWIDRNILELCCEKDRKWKECQKSPEDVTLKEEYRTLRNKVTAKIRLAKKRYYASEFESCGNSRKKWELVNDLIGKPRKQSIDNTIKKNFGDCDLEKLANDFNDTFISTIRTLTRKTPNQGRPTNLSSTLDSAYLPPMLETDLLDIINTMSTSKPVGYDRIRLRDISTHFPILRDVLLRIMNGIFLTGQIPPGLKVSIVRPIYKGGNKRDVGNYRPISILSALSYIMEKFLLKSMNSFCEKFSLLSDTQYGFRREMSTTLLLEAFSDHVYSTLENNQIALTLFLDLSKAFDTINHSILLEKLECIGFRGPYLSLFNNYFSDRYQIVRIGNDQSSQILVNSGVPQGSILGPLLFNIYVNDIATLALSSKIFQYADDTAIVFASDSYEKAVHTIQKDINILNNWFYINDIIVNKDKTSMVCFRSPHKRIQCFLPIYLHLPRCRQSNMCDCQEIKYQSVSKYLGLYLDEFFSWGPQIEYLLKRLRVVSAYLYRLRISANLKLRQLVYKALGESILRYGITIYGNCSKYKKDKLNKLLFRTAKNLAYGTKFQALETKDQLVSLDILTVEKLFNVTVAIKHYYSNEYKVERKKQKQLRHTEKYEVPKIHTNFGKGMRQYYIPALFNRLPNYLLCTQSLKIMKKELREWFISLDS